MTTTEHSASGDIDHSLELLWQMRQPSSRGRKPALTLDQIVTAAVRIADKEGLGAVSMRKIAGELGVGTMSLYRYVPGKAELLDLMLDAVYICMDPRDLAGLDWRRYIETCADDGWNSYMRHPWLLQVDQSRPLLGPNALGGLDQYLRGLDGTGLTDQEKMAVISTVDSLTVGIARSEVNAREAVERTGMTDDEFWAAQAPVLMKAMNSGNYPSMAQLSENAFAMSYREMFEFGLRSFLDGLERTIQARKAGC